MLKIIIPAAEAWDEVNQEFVYVKETELLLEHSLISLSKWESKWNKPFLKKDEKTEEEMLDYIRCMTINKNVDSSIYRNLDGKNIKLIMDYINAPMTATTFSERTRESSNRISGEIATSEVIYYWMVAHGIPFECEKWHLNRLLTLIKVCNIKSTPPEKMSKSSIMRRNSDLNAARRARLHSRG